MMDTDPPPPASRPSHGLQVTASIAVALLIVAAVIYAVTARLGPTSIAELEAREELAEEQQEQEEEAAEEREETAERAAGEREERSGRDRSGRGRDRARDGRGRN